MDRGGALEYRAHQQASRIVGHLSGSPDINDNHWAIQATLFVGDREFKGFAKEGIGVSEGKRITCKDDSCGGAYEWDRCPETTYSAKGIVAIYHQYNPEIHSQPASGGGSGCSQQIESPGILNQGDPDNSPIAIDVDRGGFRFTDLAGGVRFDLDGDGQSEQIAWLSPDSRDGWLALDRNKNGAIDDGSELFGNFTPQPPNADPHGYRALAVFDEASSGGDGDGSITAGDAVYALLRLWVDSNADGISQSDELFPLAALGVQAVALEYVSAERRDHHGNRLRYAGLVDLERGTTQSVDVFLLSD